jgi:hypothetical protein
MVGRLPLSPATPNAGARQCTIWLSWKPKSNGARAGLARMSILTTLQSDAALVEVLATVPRRRRVRPALEGIERSGRMPA